MCLWLIAWLAEAVSKLITERKRWMIKESISISVCLLRCVCVTCVNNRERARPHKMQDRRWEKQNRMIEISEKTNEVHWKEFDSFVQFQIQFQESYFGWIFICSTRWDVKMNIFVSLSIIHPHHLSHTFTEARKLNSHICKTFFAYTFVNLHVCVRYRPRVSVGYCLVLT